MYNSDLENDPEMKKIRREVAEWTKTALGKSKSARIHIGTNALNNRKIWVNDDQRAIHMHVLGRSGQGKTYLLEHMIRNDIDNRRGLCLIDPHGGLYEHVLKYCVRKRLDKKVILIDPNDDQWAVGLNYLEYNPDIYSATSHAGIVMKGIAKVFGGESPETMPRLQRWERNALVPLIRAKLTLIELFDFLDTEDPIFRQQLIDKMDSYYLSREWERFDALRKADQDLFIDSVLNRANKFTIGDTIRRIFGQQISTIDFRKAMDDGKIILCNLNCDKLSIEEQKMLGVVLIDKIYQAGRSRSDISESKRKRMPPFYFYIDEFGELVSEDVARALQELRKFRVSLVLAHQELQQLREDSPKLYSTVMAEPDIKVTFSISREDAEIMVKSLFTGKIRGDKIKRIIEQTKFWPHETTRTVQSSTLGGGSSHGTSKGGTSGDVTTNITTEAYLPEQGLLGTNTLVDVSETSGESYSISDSSGESDVETATWSETTTEVPFYEYEPFMEVSSVQYYSIEEMLEKYISWIKSQTPRYALLKIGTRAPIPIVTPFVENLPVRQKDVEAFKEKVYSQYARPATEVDEEIAVRRKALMSPGTGGLSLSEPKEDLIIPESQNESIGKTEDRVVVKVSGRSRKEIKIPKLK